MGGVIKSVLKPVASVTKGIGIGVGGIAGSSLGGIFGGLSPAMDEITGGQTSIGNSTGLNLNFGQMLSDRNANSGQINQFLDQQLLAQAKGETPSLAEMQYRKASDQNIQNQLSQAASARGVNAAFAQRGAAQNIGQLNQQAALESSMVRSQEQRDAINALMGNQQMKDNFALGLIGQGTGRDIGQGELTQKGKQAKVDLFGNILKGASAAGGAAAGGGAGGA